MFVTDNASIFTFFSEVCFNGDPFEVRIKETRNSEVKILKGTDTHTAPYAGHPAKLAPAKLQPGKITAPDSSRK
jgi:hypothetical protein